MGLNDSQSMRSHRPGLNRLASYQGHMPRVQQRIRDSALFVQGAPSQILFPSPFSPFYFSILKIFLIFLFQINIFLLFLDYFDASILKIIFKK